VPTAVLRVNQDIDTAFLFAQRELEDLAHIASTHNALHGLKARDFSRRVQPREIQRCQPYIGSSVYNVPHRDLTERVALTIENVLKDNDVGAIVPQMNGEWLPSDHAVKFGDFAPETRLPTIDENVLGQQIQQDEPVTQRRLDSPSKGTHAQIAL
jgi:hypothetical protein